MRATTPLTADSGCGQPVTSHSTSQRAFAFLFACLAFFVVNATAQISVGPTGAGPLTFDTMPPVTDFSSYVLNGNGGTYSDIATLDAGVATLDVSVIIDPLIAVAEATPGTFAGVFRYNSQLQVIQTRPTTGGTNAAAVLLGKFVNNSGQDRSSAILSYAHVTRNSITGGHLYGMSVYWSLTGAPGSWTSIPELTTEVTGDLLGSLTLGNWAQGSTLYILWVDDNSDAITDPSYTIDNLSLVFSVAAPVITRQPVGTNVQVNTRVELSVVATGLGLSYQWFKDALPLDVGAYPTATSATLIITNAQFGDAGAYHVIVSNPAGGVPSSTVRVDVADDTVAPRMLYFSQVPGSSSSFRLAVTEPLCEGAPFGTCTFGDAIFTFNWEFGEVGGGGTLITAIAPENGTNYIFAFTDGFIDPTKQYYLTPLPDSVTDRFNNPLSGSVTSSPVKVFNTDIADAEIHSNASADTPLGTATSITVDNDDAGIAQGLLRFNNLIGPGPSQIPQGAVIINATLTVNQTDNGSAANLHRMLIDWDQATVTWNSLVDGVTANNVEAVSTSDGISVNEPFPNGPMNIEVTAGVQAWANGAVNYGWAFLSTGTGGWDWNTIESGAATAPSLAVTYTVPPCTTMPAFTVHPANTTVTEGNSFTLNAGLTGACNATYQWTKDNQDIQGANGSSYTAVGVPGAGGNSGAYRLRVSNQNGTATSNPAQVTVNPDLTPPVITRVTSSADGTTVTLLFSKQLSTAGTYSFNPAVAGVAAALANGPNNGTVTVSSAARVLTTPYRLTVLGARDNRVSQNVVFPNPSIVDLTGSTPVLPFVGAGNWNYSTNDQANNPNWKTGTFGPEWLQGEQFFGFEPSAGVTNALPIQPDPIKTPLQANDTNVLGAGNSEIFVSAYFVKQITLPALEANTVFAISYYIDDGAIFYLDGAEIGRYQMPAGAVTFTTRSTGGNGEAVLQTLLFSASAGNHTLAVEVHQAGVSTSDVLFGLAINKITLPSKLAIARSNGTNILSWSADSAWALRSSALVNGNFAPVAGNPQRLFLVPPAAQTSNQFYHLHYAP